jgi:hypothetical protein
VAFRPAGKLILNLEASGAYFFVDEVSGWMVLPGFAELFTPDPASLIPKPPLHKLQPGVRVMHDAGPPPAPALSEPYCS